MISIEEAQQLILRFMKLRETYTSTKSKSDKIALEKQQRLCMEKFKYLVTMRTYKYKSFPNYDDLNQDGCEALLKSMKNYNPTKGIFFYWAHRYIETKISRSANLHTAIRYPLKYAHKNVPHKETNLPLLIEKKNCPDLQLEDSEVRFEVHQAMACLPKDQFEIINLVFGFDNKPMPINKICEQLDIPRASCIISLKKALSTLKKNIDI